MQASSRAQLRARRQGKPVVQRGQKEQTQERPSRPAGAVESERHLVCDRLFLALEVPLLTITAGADQGASILVHAAAKQ